MKKALLVVVALPVIAYPAASWFLGSKIGTILDAQYAEVGKQPTVKVVERKFERGVFSSTDVVTLEFMGEAMEAARKAGTLQGDAAKAPRISFRTQIQHGPFVGGGFNAAVADTELLLDDPEWAELKKVLNGQKPLAVHTVFHFDGGGTSSLMSPAVTTRFPEPESGKEVELAWDGLKADMTFKAGMQSYTLKGEAPRFELTDAQATHVKMTGMRFNAEQQRLQADEPMLYAGTQHITIDKVDATQAGAAEPVFSIGKMKMEVNMPVQGEYLDMVSRLGAESVVVEGGNYGPINYDFSLRHLHVKTFVELYRGFMNMYSDPALLAGGTPSMEGLMEPAMQMLAHDPVVSLDRLSFHTEDGDTLFKLSVSAPGITPDELQNPLMLMAKVKASAQVEIPEPFLLSMQSLCPPSVRDSAEGCPSEEEVEAKRMMMQQQIEMLEGQGYVKREGSVLKSDAEFKAGRLTVNGKPLNPMAMAAGQE